MKVERARVVNTVAEGRIEGAIQKGRMWFIPVGTEKPIDPRKVRKLELNKSN